MEGDMSSSQSALCRSGCGFYGNPSTEGLCSKCFKDAVVRKQTVPVDSSSSSNNNSSPRPPMTPLDVAAALVSTSTTSVEPPLPQPMEVQSNQDTGSGSSCLILPQEMPSTSSSSVLEGPSSMETSMSEKLQPQVESPVKKVKPGRCPECRAKVGLLGYPCRCGLTFCSTHRYASEHNCTFDYKEDGREQIKKNNPVVVGEKIQKI